MLNKPAFPGRYFRHFALPLVAAFIMLSSALPVAAWAGFDEATAAFSAGRFDNALKEFRKLAVGGHREAEFMLGVMSFQGRGIKQDRSVAAVWFHKAALKGHNGAQLAFGSIHVRGVGVYQNLHQAYKWLTLASTSSSSDIREKANNLIVDAARLMTPNEIDEAKVSAADFKAKASGLTRSD